jgi:hypothetical protein
MKKIILSIVFFILSVVLSFSQTSYTFFYQPFSGNSVPTNWQVWNIGGTNFTFGSGVVPGAVGDFPTNAAIFSDEAAGVGQDNVAYLSAPWVDLTDDFNTINLSFYYALNEVGNGEYLEVRLYDGITDIVIAHFDTETDPTGVIIYDIKETASSHGMNLSNILIYFKYDDNNSWGMGCGIDSVSLIGYYAENNDCSSATALTVGNYFDEHDIIVDNFNTTPSGETPIPSCGIFGSGNDTWFSVVVPDSGNLIIETKEVIGSSYGDTVITAYSGSCGSLTEIECDDTGGDGYFSKLEFNGLTPGETILIRVFEYANDQQGEFYISAYDISPPENDDCLNAISLDNFYYVDYLSSLIDANNATNNDGFITIDGCGDGMNDGVWYTFTAQHSGEVTLEVREISFSSIVLLGAESWDPEIGVYTGTCNNLSCVDYVDTPGVGIDETITFPIVFGTTYYINVGQFSHTEDNPEAYFSLKVSYSCGSYTPINNICSLAWDMSSIFSVGSYSATENATCATGGGIGICPDDMNDGVWFKFNATDSGEVEINVEPDMSWDPQIGVFSGSCGTLSCLTSVDNGLNNGDPETVTFNIVNGETYFINVGHWNPTDDFFEGPFQINAQFTSNTAAVSNETISDLEIYPNPVTNIINIKAQNNIDKISVFNQIGRLIKVLSPNNKTIQADLSNLTSGIYILKINSDNKIITKKIIKK